MAKNESMAKQIMTHAENFYGHWKPYHRAVLIDMGKCPQYNITEKITIQKTANMVPFVQKKM